MITILIKQSVPDPFRQRVDAGTVGEKPATACKRYPRTGVCGDGFRSERLPANLLQAQRDYFGAHTYERLDKPGNLSYQLTGRWKHFCILYTA